MNRRRLYKFVFVILFSLVAGCTPTSKEVKSTDAMKSTGQEKTEGYWTCSMHPQVHKNESGKCPICGMPLIHVDKKSNIGKSDISGFEPSQSQLKNGNVSKYTVAKKDLELILSVSGRLISSREISFQVYESDLAFVKQGFEISGYTSANPDSVMNGKISRIDNLVDPSSRTIRVSAVFQSSFSPFVAETSFHGQVQNRIKDQIVIPEDAILRAGKRDLVYIFTSDGKLEPREVVLGQKGHAEYQILSGLKEGEVISAGANFLIDSEAKIRGFK